MLSAYYARATTSSSRCWLALVDLSPLDFLNSPQPFNLTPSTTSLRNACRKQPAQHALSTLPTQDPKKTIEAIDLTYFSNGRDTGQVDEHVEPLHRGLWAARFVSVEDLTDSNPSR